MILYVLGNACYIFNSSNNFFLQIHFTRIIDMHFLKTMFRHFHLVCSKLPGVGAKKGESISVEFALFSLSSEGYIL